MGWGWSIRGLSGLCDNRVLGGLRAESGWFCRAVGRGLLGFGWRFLHSFFHKRVLGGHERVDFLLGVC